jgi:hypothetical protein
MRAFSVVVLIASVLCVFALPADHMRFASKRRSDDHSFKAPASGDVRAPCPFLNMLANHGYLPRDGKGITEEVLSTNIKDVLGTSTIFAAGLAKAAMMIFKGPDGKLNLDALLKFITEGGLEHYASQSRPDRKSPAVNDPNQAIPDPARVENNLKIMGKSKDTDVITLEDLAKLRQALNAASEKAIPALATNSSLMWTKQKFIAAAEACFLFGVAGGKEGKGPTVAHYRSIMAESKLPADFVKSGAWFGWGFTNFASCMVKFGFKSEDIHAHAGAPPSAGAMVHLAAGSGST